MPTIQARPPRTITAEHESEIRLYIDHFGTAAKSLLAELEAERSISRLLASAIELAAPECCEETRRKLADVMRKYINGGTQ